MCAVHFVWDNVCYDLSCPFRSNSILGLGSGHYCCERVMCPRRSVVKTTYSTNTAEVKKKNDQS